MINGKAQSNRIFTNIPKDVLEETMPTMRIHILIRARNENTATLDNARQESPKFSLR